MRLSTLFIFLTMFITQIANAQEWSKKDAGRTEYIQDRSDCAQQAQKMALVGEELQKDIVECLATKGWQRNQANELLALHCEDRPAVTSCRRGGTSEIYMVDRAECTTQVLKTVGSKYSRPGWNGLGGLIISSMQVEENKKALQQAQVSAMSVCLEGKGWKVEMKATPVKSAEQQSQ